MALFQKSVLNKFIKSQDTVKIEAAYKRFFDNFQKADRQAEIRAMKEEEYQDGFLDDLFVNILGYVKRPNAGFNLVREKKNEADSKKADGAILKNDMPLAVIELKGTDTTDLDKVTNQGFGYKNNHKECVYVVISNFEKLRFYIHHAVDYIEFNLFTLTKEDFTTLWLCLHSDNLLDNIPAKIKAESVVKEEDITKNLYKDYSSFKQELWQSIVSLNPEGDPLMFYKKTQKLIDRFLFIFFAEDAGLLPPNSISRMVERWQMLKDEDAYKPLYDIFKQYFGYINTGRPGKTPQDEIFAYNGGLMLEDDVLDTVSISDEVLLKHTLKLTVYDFSSEVDVNILGHIFENSLNDIEAVTAELEGQEIDKSKTKRKKDGVFYTPKYITKYIVDNTVGKLCDEKKVELNIIDEEYAKGRSNRKKETLKQLDENLQAYRNWLLNITICDPACGSGAFLNQALEYLMEEHRYIDELESQLLGAGFTFPGVENHILENNIFGVDINDESIEIAKLSLWLRTAQRGRKLTSLNNNIKCGNSLIDDPQVAGDKAFSWEKEFPTVFEEKNKFAYHVTTSIHDSRTSERMIKYKARERRFDGTKPDPEVFPMTKEEEELIATTVSDIAKEDNLNIAAFNLCWDHMHILLVCEEVEVPKIMHKIKGRTARACNVLRNKGINPLDIMRKDGSMPFWTQKYGCKPITTDDQFWNTYNYIEKNKVKHNLPKNPKLEKSILGFVKTYEECFKIEYRGGFDVIIGNPPYVQVFDIVMKTELELKYEVFRRNNDLYSSFYELSINILKSNGILGFITPNSFVKGDYFINLREFFIKYQINSIVDFNNFLVFDDANVFSAILIIEKREPNKSWLLKSDLDTIKGEIEIGTSTFIQDNIILKKFTKEKVFEDFFHIKDVGFNYWSIGGEKKRGNSIGDRVLYRGIKQIFEDISYTKGSNFNRYTGIENENFLKYNYKDFLNENDTFRFSEILLKTNPKLIYRQTSSSLIATVDFDSNYCDKTVHIIVNKDNITINYSYLMTIFNSKLLNYFYRLSTEELGRAFAQVKTVNVKKLPFILSENQQPFIQKADLMLTLNKDLHEQSQKFQRTIQRKFELEDLPKKLQDWYKLPYSEFIKELGKKKVSLSLSQEAEWEDYFMLESKKALDLLSRIDQTDKEIDRMVYELYGLTQEEIHIVENS